MRWCWLLLLCVLLWPALSRAQCPGITTQLTPFAKETLTIAGTAMGLTPSIYQPPGTLPVLAMLTVTGSAIHYDLIGLPTTTIGHFAPGSPPHPIAICGLTSIRQFRALVPGTGTATVHATYYKTGP